MYSASASPEGNCIEKPKKRKTEHLLGERRMLNFEKKNDNFHSDNSSFGNIENFSERTKRH